MIFHSFILGDSEDPELYAAQSLWEWQQSEMGAWVMQHCKDPAYKIMTDANNFGYRVVIYGNLSEQDSTYFTLKYQ